MHIWITNLMILINQQRLLAMLGVMVNNSTLNLSFLFIKTTDHKLCIFILIFKLNIVR